MEQNNNTETSTSPIETVLYKIEQAIKEYRKMSQKNIGDAGIDITIDQGLVLTLLHNQKSLSQVDIAKKIFKDNASITRILKLMVEKGYIHKKTDPNDKRRSQWHITASGKHTVQQLQPVIKHNRMAALKTLKDNEINALSENLQLIVTNCQTTK